MTATPDEGDVQRVAEVLEEMADNEPDWGECVDAATRLLAALDLPARDACVAAAAWDEGYNSGWLDYDEHAHRDKVQRRSNSHAISEKT